LDDLKHVADDDVADDKDNDVIDSIDEDDIYDLAEDIKLYEDDMASTQSINPTKEDSDKEDLEEEHLFEDLEEELHKTDKKHEESGFLDSDEIDALEHEFLIDDKDDNVDLQTNELNLPDYSNLYDSFKESILLF